MTKTDIIAKVYNDFYGSIKQTYEEARKIDQTIKYDDIKHVSNKIELVEQTSKVIIVLLPTISCKSTKSICSLLTRMMMTNIR